MRSTIIFLFTLVCHVARNSEIAKPFYTVIEWMPLSSVLSQMFVIVHYYCKEADFHSTCILAGVADSSGARSKNQMSMLVET
jgi:hypothetical protein